VFENNIASCPDFVRAPRTTSPISARHKSEQRFALFVLSFVFFVFEKNFAEIVCIQQHKEKKQ
jgi:hypothetical protein